MPTFLSKSVEFYFADRTFSTVSSREESFHGDGPGVVSPFVPVQGQRRNMGEKSQRGRKPGQGQMTNKEKNNCKQQWEDIWTKNVETYDYLG